MTALLASTGSTASVSGYMFVVGLVSLACAYFAPETHPRTSRVFEGRAAVGSAVRYVSDPDRTSRRDAPGGGT